MNLDIVGTHNGNVGTHSLNGNDWPLLSPASLILTFDLLPFLEDPLNGAMPSPPTF